MELTGIKCNECGTRAFLEDPDSPEWATCKITVPALRLQTTVHYCPTCRDRLLDKVGNQREQLTTAQHRVIDPGAPNRELQEALGGAAQVIDDQNGRDLERAGMTSPPRGMPVVPPDERRGPRETVPHPVVAESSVNGTGPLPVTSTAVVPANMSSLHDPTVDGFWGTAPPGDAGFALGSPPPEIARTKPRTKERRRRGPILGSRATIPATLIAPVAAVLSLLGYRGR